MSFLPPHKRVVRLDEATYNQLAEFAKQQQTTMDQAARCFVRAGISDLQYAQTVGAMLDEEPIEA